MTTEELKAVAAGLKKEAEGDGPDRQEAKLTLEVIRRILREREQESEQENFDA